MESKLGLTQKINTPEELERQMRGEHFPEGETLTVTQYMEAIAETANVLGNTFNEAVQVFKSRMEKDFAGVGGLNVVDQQRVIKYFEIKMTEMHSVTEAAMIEAFS